MREERSGGSERSKYSAIVIGAITLEIQMHEKEVVFAGWFPALVAEFRGSRQTSASKEQSVEWVLSRISLKNN